MKNIHPLTTAGIGIGVAALAALFSGNYILSGGLGVAGYFFTLPEVPKFSSYYQYVMFLLHGTIIGGSLDLLVHSVPVFSIAMFLGVFATLPRLVFMRQVMHTKLLWLEPLMLTAAYGGWIAGAIMHYTEWPVWLYPLLPLAFATYLVRGFVIEGRAYLRIEHGESSALTGTAAPDFELPDQFGQPVRLSAFREKRCVLLIFVRGDWCPACHMMLRSYERRRETFQEKDVLLLAIGPDDLGTNREMAERLGIEFRILTDPKQETAQRYGVHQKSDPVNSKLRKQYEAGLPMPATFLICPQGIIRYHTRADRAGELLQPAQIFEVLEKIATPAFA